ncbi:hypothetical protein Sjap_018680 [Stephania japonica]|uniref:Peptidase S59 domain-containing protein n=1 Tax=Stephania japonica TaxID=461633 RepID=A0AAP0NLT5_9MAGN
MEVGTSEPSTCSMFDMGSSLCLRSNDVDACFQALPVLCSPDYFMVPSLEELGNRESIDPGHCSRVKDFTVGRFGYGSVRFLGETDVRWLNLDQIVKFIRHEIVVYEDENYKPVVGHGLNKAAEVTLILQVKSSALKENQMVDVVTKLRSSTERQGASFLSFDPLSGEWKFLVPHFSRFGLTEDDEEDNIMDEANVTQHSREMDEDELSEIAEEAQFDPDDSLLPHSLPAHLGLNPIKMQEMRMLMFPADEDAETFEGPFSDEKLSFGKDRIRSNPHHSAQKMSNRSGLPTFRRTPMPLLEYNVAGSHSSPPGNILMAWENKVKRAKIEGFKLDLKCETPITGSHSKSIVDAGLFMGRSFRVGWGPNGVLFHTGAPVGKIDSWKGLSSVITVEKVAIDKIVRDENDEVKEELVDSCFISPLNFHKSLSHETAELELGPSRLKLQKLVSDRVTLPEICRGYIEVVEGQLDVPGLTATSRMVLMHQVMVWELIKVLFSATEFSGHFKHLNVDDEEDAMHDDKEGTPDIDVEALPLVRRAAFSHWLRESVYHRVQDEISCLNESSDLEHIFLLLTGRQLDAAVELAAFRGDVRLGCLLSQAGGSMLNRSDISRQLDLWRMNGLDFNFVEKDRIKLYELLSGNIQGALGSMKLDWKRFLGLLMWYQLPPDTSLPEMFHAYEQLLEEGKAPYPVPMYIDEGPSEDSMNWTVGDRFDLAYYLMLLHGNDDNEFKYLKTMFSAFSSTHDPLDYHMIWHQRAILEAVGAFSSNDLCILDMSLVSQLLCLGQCHWAIYVALHTPYHENYPYLHARLIREILFQYCEIWSTEESQRQFIEHLGVPSSWMHEAIAVYFNYHGDHSKALDHFLESHNWQRAHSVFMTSVAHSLFLSGEHSEIWRLSTSMENHKSEIADWDLGAGIYISFYHIKSSLQEEAAMDESDMAPEAKHVACKDFFGRLNESLAVWRNRIPVDARATYSTMAEEICTLLLSNGGKGSSASEVPLSFEAVVSAPLPEDLRSCHLQEAISLFTYFLSETTT